MEAPDLLVLDEPTNALDEEGLQLVRTILREERKRGATILIASHNKDDIQLLADVKYEVLNGSVMIQNDSSDQVPIRHLREKVEEGI